MQMPIDVNNIINKIVETTAIIITKLVSKSIFMLLLLLFDVFIL